MKVYKIVSKVETYVEATSKEDAEIKFDCEDYFLRNEGIAEITEVNGKQEKVIKATFLNKGE